jgi:DNA-binding NarL/FixJ family response regulator
MNARTEAENLIFRRRALEAARMAPQHSLREIWTRLARGFCRVSDAFSDPETSYLVLCQAPDAATAIRPRQVQVLEKVLCGSGQKLLAIDLNLSSSTIATVARRALANLGIDCRPSRVPLSLVLAAQASQDGSERLTAGVATFEHALQDYLVVSMRRPDCHLDTLLPPAEVEVVRARIEGYSHRNIAGLRRTSLRTVANQLASASRRLGTSGRLEMIRLLVTPKTDFVPRALAS